MEKVVPPFGTALFFSSLSRINLQACFVLHMDGTFATENTDEKCIDFVWHRLSCPLKFNQKLSGELDLQAKAYMAFNISFIFSSLSWL